MFKFFKLDPEKTLKKTKELRDSGEFEKALKLAKKALKDEREHLGLNLMALELSFSTNPSEAFVHFQRCIKSPKTKKSAENLLLDNLQKKGIEKLKEVYFESLLEDLRLKEAKEFFHNLKREEIKDLNERYTKVIENLYPDKIGIETEPPRTLIRAFLVKGLVEWELQRFDSAKKWFDACFKHFKETRGSIEKVLSEESIIGRDRLEATFLLGELLYKHKDELKGIQMLSRVLETEESPDVSGLVNIFEDRKPETDEGKFLFAKILIQNNLISQAGPVLLKLSSSPLKEQLPGLTSNIPLAPLSNNLQGLESFFNLYINIGNLKQAVEVFSFLFTNFREESLKFLSNLEDELCKEFQPAPLRSLLETIKDNFEITSRFLKNIVQKNSKILYEREFSGILNGLYDEVPASTGRNDILNILALNLFRTGEYGRALTISQWLIRNGNLYPEIVDIFKSRKDELKKFALYHFILYELNLRNREKAGEVLIDIYNTFPDIYNSLLVFLDDFSKRVPEYAPQVLQDLESLRKNTDIPLSLISIVKAEILLRLERYREAQESYYDSLVKGLKWARVRIKEVIDEYQEIPLVQLLKAKLEVWEKNFYEARESFKGLLRKDPHLIKDVAAFIREKLKTEKSFPLALTYLEILVIQGYYDPALAFSEKLLSMEGGEFEGDIKAMSAQILWEKEKVKESQKLIKEIFIKKLKFSPDLLLSFVEKKIEKGKHLPFLYQTLGTLSIMSGQPEKAALSYLNLAMVLPGLVPKIQKMLNSLISQYPENIGVKAAEAGLKFLNKETEPSFYSFLTLIEEEPAEAKTILNFVEALQVQNAPQFLYLKARLNFLLKDEEQFIKYVEQAFALAKSKALKEQIIKLVEESIREKFALWKSIFFFAHRFIAQGEKERVLNVVVSNPLPEDEDLLLELKNLLLSMEEDFKENKDFNLLFGDVLRELKDSNCIEYYKIALPDKAEAIEARYEELEEYPGFLSLGVKISIILKDYDKFITRIADIKGEEKFSFLKQAVGLFPYKSPLYKMAWESFISKKDIEFLIGVCKKIIEEDSDIEFKISCFMDLSYLNPDGEELKPLFMYIVENEDPLKLANTWEKVYNNKLMEYIDIYTEPIDRAKILRKSGRYDEAKKILFENLESAQAKIELSKVFENEGNLVSALSTLEGMDTPEIRKRVKSLRKKFSLRRRRTGSLIVNA